MSEQSQEPTMEEILASIRRIISEDETPGESAAPADAAVAAEAAPDAVAAAPEPEIEAASPPPPPPEPIAAAPPPPEPAVHVLDDDDEDDLELTQKVETHGDLDILGPEPEPAPPAPTVALVSDHVAAVASSAFDKLSASILMPATDRTLEDVVRSMLQPMLKQWLDENLPAIVQGAVQAEVERIARGRVR